MLMKILKRDELHKHSENFEESHETDQASPQKKNVKIVTGLTDRGGIFVTLVLAKQECSDEIQIREFTAPEQILPSKKELVSSCVYSDNSISVICRSGEIYSIYLGE